MVHAFEGDQMTAFINHGDAHGYADFLGFRLGTAYKNGRVVIGQSLDRQQGSSPVCE